MGQIRIHVGPVENGENRRYRRFTDNRLTEISIQLQRIQNSVKNIQSERDLNYSQRFLLKMFYYVYEKLKKAIISLLFQRIAQIIIDVIFNMFHGIKHHASIYILCFNKSTERSQFFLYNHNFKNNDVSKRLIISSCRFSK